MRRTHPLIVGGGPAGAMAAIALARAGRAPMLLERSREPHDVVCGGFLADDALALLEQAGIDAAALGARPIRQLHIVAGDRSTLVDLPFRAAGLSRRTLDAALLDFATASGAAIERGTAVRDIDVEGRRIRLADGADLQGETIFLATGKYELRGSPRAVQQQSDPPVGLRVRLEATPTLVRALIGRIELILYDRGYAGLVLQEDGSANLCLTVAQSRLAWHGGDRARLLASLAGENPILGERLGSAKGLGGWASVARVPYGWRTASTVAGLFRLGDQAAVIASLAGDGIGIALDSARMAADHYLREGGSGAPAYQQSFARTARKPLWLAEQLRSVAERPALAPAAIAMLDRLPFLSRAAARATRVVQ